MVIWAFEKYPYRIENTIWQNSYATEATYVSCMDRDSLAVVNEAFKNMVSICGMTDENRDDLTQLGLLYQSYTWNILKIWIHIWYMHYLFRAILWDLFGFDQSNLSSRFIISIKAIHYQYRGW